MTILAHVERKRIKLRKVKQSIAGQEALVQAAHSRPRKELLNLLASVPGISAVHLHLNQLQSFIC